MTKPTIPEDAPLCACGCGEYVTWNRGRQAFNRYRQYHAARVQPTGDAAYRWNGGETEHEGYVSVFLPEHRLANSSGYVRRCRLVAEHKIGRLLRRGEVVHHINQIRDDDRPENLDVLPNQSVHIAGHNRGVSRARALTAEQVVEMCALSGTMTYKEIANRFGVGTTTVRSILLGEKGWLNVTNRLEFVRPVPRHNSPRMTPETIAAILNATGPDRATAARLGVNMNTIRTVRFRERRRRNAS